MHSGNLLTKVASLPTKNCCFSTLSWTASAGEHCSIAGVWVRPQSELFFSFRVSTGCEFKAAISAHCFWSVFLLHPSAPSRKRYLLFSCVHAVSPSPRVLRSVVSAAARHSWTSSARIPPTLPPPPSPVWPESHSVCLLLTSWEWGLTALIL